MLYFVGYGELGHRERREGLGILGHYRLGVPSPGPRARRACQSARRASSCGPERALRRRTATRPASRAKAASLGLRDRPRTHGPSVDSSGYVRLPTSHLAAMGEL